MKPIAALLLLVSALATAGCAGSGSTFETFNAPPVYEGPGCYDHRNRLERTIRTQAECTAATWVWKP